MSTQQNDDESTQGKPKRVVGRPWTREEARAAALAREARKPAAREAAKGYQAPPEPSDAQNASAEPTQGTKNDVQQDLNAWMPPKGSPPGGDEPQEQTREQARQEQAWQARARAAERLAKRQAMRAAIILEDRRLLGDVMDPWQAEDFAKLDDPGTRHAYLERPRGHSKTGDIASEALIELLDADLPNRKLYCFAADEDQARLVYDDVVGKLLRGQIIQADRGPLEPGKVRVLKNEIHSYTGSVLKVMAADVASSWGLRPDWVACDEVVEWRYETLWQALRHLGDAGETHYDPRTKLYERGRGVTKSVTKVFRG